MSYQLQEINRRIDQDVKGFLEECDAQYAQKVSQAADAILTNLPHSPIVLLSGPSGSGKTTTALKIEEELEKRKADIHAAALEAKLASEAIDVTIPGKAVSIGHLHGQLLQTPGPQNRPPDGRRAGGL